MRNLNILTHKKRTAILKKREDETKFGEHILLVNNFTNTYEDFKSLDVDYIILGISEDIGITANYGKTGAYKAWEATIKVLLNIQSNEFLNVKRVAILGHLEYHDKRKSLQSEKVSDEKRVEEARKFVETIDNDVSHLIELIIKAGKIPIIIGGGHNNAYGNIKGVSKALSQPINVVNFDAHHDYRKREGRHSGNGFSYARYNKFLKNYFIFGLHENFISNKNLNTLRTTDGIAFNTFEDIAIHKKIKFKSEMQKALDHVSGTRFGIEIDCDAIENISSSAMTPNGFSPTKARQFVSVMGNHKNACYLHICEASPTTQNETQIGKLITYLITDFIKAHANNHN